MNFLRRLSSTVSNQSQRGSIQSDTNNQDNAVGRHQVFLRTWKRIGLDYATLHLTAENTIMPGLQGWVPGEVLLRYGSKLRGNSQPNTMQTISI